MFKILEKMFLKKFKFVKNSKILNNLIVIDDLIITYKNNVVGYLETTYPYKMHLMVSDKEEDNALKNEYRWISISKRSISLSDAKEYLNKRIQIILNNFSLI